MRHITSFLVVFLLILGVGLSCKQKTEQGMMQETKKTGKVIVQVGDEVITQSDIDLLLQVNPRLKRRINTPEGKKQILENYVAQSLMYQESKRQGLSDDPVVKAKLVLYGKVVLAHALLDARLTEETKKYFDEHKAEFEKVKIAHIYIPFKTKKKNPALSKDAEVKRSEKLAKKEIEKISAQLKKDPKQFAKLAEEKSEDARTQKRGGELGWLAINDARMAHWGWSQLIEKSFPLETGAISEPIRSDNGYHIVLVLEGKKVDDFEEVKSKIRFKLQSQVRNGLVNELKDKYEVSYKDEPQLPAKEPAEESEVTEKD